MFTDTHQIDWGVFGNGFVGYEERQQRKYITKDEPKWLIYYF